GDHQREPFGERRRHAMPHRAYYVISGYHRASPALTKPLQIRHNHASRVISGNLWKQPNITLPCFHRASTD
ncbi:MAG: hypothetical protein WA728_25560, partial [Xanthobacteraceae bacterium]